MSEAAPMKPQPLKVEPLKAQSRLGAWLDHHAYSLVAGVGHLLRRPWATALTVGVMAIALALPLGLWAGLKNVERFAGTVQQSRRVDAFLRPAVAAEAAQALAATLRTRADVAEVAVRTPEQGLEELRRAGLGDALDVLDRNPLPSLLLVTPRGDGSALADALRAMPDVEQVRDDSAWRERLSQWLDFAARLAWVLAALLGLGALLVVGNTVRLDIQARREEIAVLQLLGARDGFIRRPFLYLGAGYGALAGVLALAMLTSADLALRAPLADLAAAYGSRFALQGFDLREGAAVVMGAALLGWLGAGLVAGHYLRQTRPVET